MISGYIVQALAFLFSIVFVSNATEPSKSKFEKVLYTVASFLTLAFCFIVAVIVRLL